MLKHTHFFVFQVFLILIESINIQHSLLLQIDVSYNLSVMSQWPINVWTAIIELALFPL